MEFSVSNFKGSTPRIADHLIVQGTAKTAMDCKLSTGQLDSWREPLPVESAAPLSATLRFYGNCNFDVAATCVDWTQAGSLCSRFFSTGDTPRPVTGIFPEGSDNLRSTWLGVPCPTQPPTASPRQQQGGVKDKEGRSYAYQYVNSFGERGALSPGTPVLNVPETTPVAITSWAIPEPEWGIEKVRIYRTVNGHESGREEVNTFDTTWMLVAEISIHQGLYVDSKANEELSEALEEDLVIPPPESLQGITLMDSQDILAGYTGKRIYFSEANSFHNWPHYLELDDVVCGIVESNGILYVATDGRPYAITATTDCKSAGCREVVRLPGNFPKLGCGNRTMAKLRIGAVYPTHDGLVLLAGKNAPTILSWGLYTPEQWQLMQPHTAVPVEHGGRLFVFCAGGSFVMQAPGGATQGWENDFHSQLSDTDIIDAHATASGDLYILRKDGTVALWDRGEELRPHRWESGEYVLPTDRALGAGRLHTDFGSERLKVEVDGRVVLDRDVLSSRVFRLPMYATGSRWRFTLTGTSRVSLLSLATGMQDLGV